MIPLHSAARGLEGLGAAAPQPQAKGPFDIYQRPKVQGLLALLAAHPEASAALKDSLLQATLAPIQQQQATTQANRQDFGQMAAQLAGQPGQTPEMLTAQLGAVYPNITQGNYGQNALEGLTSALPGASDAVPPEDIPVINETDHGTWRRFHSRLAIISLVVLGKPGAPAIGPRVSQKLQMTWA